MSSLAKAFFKLARAFIKVKFGQHSQQGSDQASGLMDYDSHDACGCDREDEGEDDD